MTFIKNKRGAWINGYAQPTRDAFAARTRAVGYVVLKYGMADGLYEGLARAHGVPWLAERMAESGAGDQYAPQRATMYGSQLAEQSRRAGCVGAVINLEEADGGWHRDADGSGTRALILRFRNEAAPGMPLYASLDTRGARPSSAYQRVAAEMCDGVMPMIYPQAFYPKQGPGFVERAFMDCLSPQVYERWRGKEIHPTIQTYGDITPAACHDQAVALRALLASGLIAGANFYTLGHATAPQWERALEFVPPDFGQHAPPPSDYAQALIALAAAWRAGWTLIATKGTIAEAEAYADYWRALVGGGDVRR